MLARLALGCAGSCTPFLDLALDLASDPFRTRFWDPLEAHVGLFFDPFRSSLPKSPHAVLFVASWEAQSGNMRPLERFSSRSWTARRP